MKQKSRILFLLFSMILFFSIVMITACGPAQRPGPTESTPTPSTPAVPQEAERAQKLAEKISELEEVNSATVVISENQAWVGVDLKAGLEDELTDEMKNEITSLVKKEDNKIKTVYVTADADIVTRLRNIAKDVADGKPISGFADELNEIGRRITPSQQ